MRALLHYRPKLPTPLNHQIKNLSQPENIVKSSNGTILEYKEVDARELGV